MAQLKDLNVAGQSRFVGDVYANKIHGTLDSGGTASQLVAGNGTLQQIVSAITDSTAGVPNPKAVYDYVAANGLKMVKGSLHDDTEGAVKIDGYGQGLLCFYYSTYNATYYIDPRSPDHIYEIYNSFGPYNPEMGTGIKCTYYFNSSSDYYVGLEMADSSSADYVFICTAGDLNITEADSVDGDIITPVKFLIGNIATQDQIDALFVGGGSGSGSGGSF